MKTETMLLVVFVLAACGTKAKSDSHGLKAVPPDSIIWAKKAARIESRTAIGKESYDWERGNLDDIRCVQLAFSKQKTKDLTDELGPDAWKPPVLSCRPSAACEEGRVKIQKEHDKVLEEGLVRLSKNPEGEAGLLMSSCTPLPPKIKARIAAKVARCPDPNALCNE